jgi:hypothetical protein
MQYFKFAIFVALFLTASGGAEAQVMQTKLDLSYLTKQQRATLLKLVDDFAFYETYLLLCSRTSNIERRMVAAAKDCVADGALHEIAKEFHKRKEYWGRDWKKADCASSKAVEIGNRMILIINDRVQEVTRMCRACLFCKVSGRHSD